MCVCLLLALLVVAVVLKTKFVLLVVVDFWFLFFVEGPPYLASNPPYLFGLFCFCWFVWFLGEG